MEYSNSKNNSIKTQWKVCDIDINSKTKIGHKKKFKSNKCMKYV